MAVQRQYDSVVRNHDQIRDLRDRNRATQTDACPSSHLRRAPSLHRPASAPAVSSFEAWTTPALHPISRRAPTFARAGPPLAPPAVSSLEAWTARLHLHGQASTNAASSGCFQSFQQMTWEITSGRCPPHRLAVTKR